MDQLNTYFPKFTAQQNFITWKSCKSLQFAARPLSYILVIFPYTSKQFLATMSLHLNGEHSLCFYHQCSTNGKLASIFIYEISFDLKSFNWSLDLSTLKLEILTKILRYDTNTILWPAFISI